MISWLLIYFFAGMVQDFFLTLNWRYIAADKKIAASTSSFLTTVISMLVLYNILTNLDSQRSLVAIIIYALGIGTGTLLAMLVKKGFKK